MTTEEYLQAQRDAEAHLADMRIKMAQEKHWRFLQTSAVILGVWTVLFALARYLPEVVLAWKLLVGDPTSSGN